MNAAKFFRRIERQGDCYVWTGGRQSTGYGLVSLDGGPRQLVHRLVYEMFVGPIPPGWQVDHLCRNRLCVKVSHLEAVTQAENLRRQGAAVTHCRHGHAYTPENTLRHGTTGYRRCRACSVAREKVRPNRHERARMRALEAHREPVTADA